MTISDRDAKLIQMANDVFKLAGDLYRDEFGSDKSSQREFCRRVAIRFAGVVGMSVVESTSTAERKIPLKPDKSAHKSQSIQVPTGGELASEATDLAERIIELAEHGDMPANGIDYAESVAAKARDILESIEESGRATTGQVQALQNMLDGLERWFHG